MLRPPRSRPNETVDARKAGCPSHTPEYAWQEWLAGQLAKFAGRAWLVGKYSLISRHQRRGRALRIVSGLQDRWNRGCYSGRGEWGLETVQSRRYSVYGENFED